MNKEEIEITTPYLEEMKKRYEDEKKKMERDEEKNLKELMFREKK